MKSILTFAVSVIGSQNVKVKANVRIIGTSMFGGEWSLAMWADGEVSYRVGYGCTLPLPIQMAIQKLDMERKLVLGFCCDLFITLTEDSVTRKIENERIEKVAVRGTKAADQSAEEAAARLLNS